MRIISFRQAILFVLLQTSLVLYLARFLKAPLPYLCLLSIPLIYNLKTLDCLRYGSFFDSVAYFELTLMLTFYYLEVPTRFPVKVWTLVGICFLLHCLLTAGYPPTLIYATYGFGGAAIALFWHHKRDIRSWSSRLLPLGGAVGTAVLLGAPYWMGSIDVARVNSFRTHHSTLEWSSSAHCTILGLVANVFFPWSAGVHSAFLGSAAASIVAVGAIAFFFSKVRANWLLLALISAPLLWSLGPTTPVYEWFFRHSPGFAWLRVPGRYLILFYSALIVAVPLANWSGARRWFRFATAVIAAGTFCVLALETFFPGFLSSLQVGDVSPQAINGSWVPSMRMGWIIAGLLTCLGAWFSTGESTSGWRKFALACALMGTVAQTYTLFHYGTWVQSDGSAVTKSDIESMNHLPLYGQLPLVGFHNGLYLGVMDLGTADYARFYEAAGDKRDCYLPVHEVGPSGSIQGSVSLPFYLNAEFVCSSSDEESVAQLRASACGPRGVAPVVVQQRGCIPTSSSGLRSTIAEINARNRLLGLSPNGFRLAAETTGPSWLVTPYPWDEGHWRAELDGRPAELIPINGGFVGLNVQAGKHEMAIHHFSPRYLLGLNIAAITSVLLLVACVLGFTRLRRDLGVIQLAFLTAAAAGLAAFFIWSSRTYPARSATMLQLSNNYSELLRSELRAWSSSSVLEQSDRQRRAE